MANNFKIAGDFYVSTLDGNDSNAGTPDAPFKTVGAAITAADSAGTYQTIVIGAGVYNESLGLNASYKYYTFIGDGKVIFDGTGLTNAFTGVAQTSRMQNVTFTNYTGIFCGSTESQDFRYTNVRFKSISNYYPTYMRYFQTNASIFQNCIFEDVTGYYGQQLRMGVYQNCVFIGGHPALSQKSYFTGTSIYLQQYYNCIFFAKSEGEYMWQGASYDSLNPHFTNCVFDPKGQLTFYDVVGYKTGSFLTHQALESTYGPRWANPFHGGNYQASMSINENISGSGEMSLALSTMPINAENTEMFRNHRSAPIFQLPGGRALATAYGHDSSSANPLHPAGGAVFSNITTGSLGGFQIDNAASGFGTITSAVIDQGTSKIIKEIDAAFVTTAPNAAAASTFPSGSNNHTPVRYQYELRYGNNSDLSSNEYKIFEWGQMPLVDSVGTGSGDVLFDTGSQHTNVAARYLQLRITLRNNMSGSL